MGSYTLLFVDDETSILSSLYRVFRKEGYEILKSDNPADALKILKDKKVHLILSDYRMPEMDGVAFMHEAMKIQPDAIRIILSGYAESSVIISAINNGGIFKFLTKPWDDDLLKVEVRHALERYELEDTNTKLIEDVKRRNEILKNVNQLLSEKVDEIQESVISTIEMLIYLSKTKGSDLPGNIENATSIGVAVGKRLGLDENDLKNLNIAIRLHDIGNVGVDSCILNKSAALNAEERIEVQRHPVIGGKVLSFLKGYESISEIVRFHHENYDGSGYPDGLKGTDIPLLSRIVHLVDAYDSLTSSRPYRAALEYNEIIKILKNERGKKFDPEIIDVFLEMLE
ncbi:MAG: response regulator [Nitrospira sp.]|nr:response regulator [Nitrospira sp.]